MKRARLDLDKIAPFGDLPAAKIKELESSAEMIDLKTRQVVYDQGGVADNVYLLLSGGVKLIRKGSGKRPFVAEFVSPGALFGYADRLNKIARSEKAVSAQPGLALVWSSSEFSKAFEANLQGARAFTAYLASQIKLANDRLEEQAVSNLRYRLVKLIHRLAVDFGQKNKDGILINLRITHQEMADYLGASRESVTVTIASLRKAKIIKMDVRRIVVPDLRALLKS